MNEPLHLSTLSDAERILDCISDAVLTIAPDRRVTFVNRAMRRLLGYEEAEELAGSLQACDVLVQSSICNTADCVFERAMRGERVSDCEAFVRRRDGRLVPVSMSTDILRDDHDRLIGLIEVIRDLSVPKALAAKSEEVIELRRRLGEQTRFENIVGRSRTIQEIFSILPAVAGSKTSVLITGESGTGKELVAYALHAHSPRKDKPFVAVHCGALSEGLLESELFGHVRGAFTGAYYDKLGRFELADGGTIFLDEIGDISPATQIKLLRVLEREEFERVGGTRTIKVDVRLVAATNQDLAQLVKEGRFREDLYYRVRVFPIRLPSLRERRDDIPLLVSHFMEKFSGQMGKPIRRITPEALDHLSRYGYPGNVRELQNIIEHAFVCCEDDILGLHHLPKDILSSASPGVAQELPSGASLRHLEREAIMQVLSRTGWRYKDAAEQLGISRSTLWRKLRRLKIAPPKTFRSKPT